MSHKHDKKSNNPFKNDELDEQINESSVEETAEEIKEEAKQEDNELQKKFDALNNQYLRLAADFDNYRKRQEHEREELLKFGTENALKK